MRKQVNQIMKQNYKCVTLLMAVFITTLLLSSCKSTPDMTYAGDVIRFGKDVETSYTTKTRGWLMNILHQSKPFNLGDAEQGAIQQWKMYREIDKEFVKDANNTSTYYAMELAAKRIKYVRRNVFHNDPNTQYYVFLFTDGLENSSPEIAERDGRTWFRITPEKYQKRLHRKLKKAIGHRDNIFKVYPFVYTGQDLQTSFRNYPDETVCKLIHSNLDSVRYCHKNHKERPQFLLAAPEDLNLPSCVCNDDNSKHKCDKSSNFSHSFVDMVQSIRDELDRTTIKFSVARGYAGKKKDGRGKMVMQFTDTTSNPPKTVTLTFKLNKKCGSYSIDDAVFEGHEAKARGIRPIGKDDANEIFIIDDFRIRNEKKLWVAFHPNIVTQSYVDPTTGILQKNSEYNKTPEEAFNAYFIIVMDHSNSMNIEKDNEENDGGGIENEKLAAQDVLLIMSGNAMGADLKKEIQEKMEQNAQKKH